VWPTEPLANPLQDWFVSLEKLKSRMPEDVLVLPAHGKPFRGAHVRLDELAREHTDRLNLLLDICAEPLRVVDTFESLYSARIGDNNRIMATGEAIAHLRYLCDTGQMNAVQDENGVMYYQRA
jgi:glyoxylase-like metal-dependent hydrolase (beta-lactamase superfamily II)